MKRALILLLSAAAGLNGCSAKQRVDTETALAKALVSDADEEQMGLQVKQELEEKQHVRYLEDPAVNHYVAGVAERIFTLAKKDRPNQKWQLAVIDDPKTVNAFATPGGYVYVYTGLLLAADNEAEVAGVLAHESGHVVARHVARQLVETYGLEAVAALALGENPSLLQKLAASIGTNGALLAHSRSDESEADEYGVRYSSAAGYDPRGLSTFFQKLLAQQGRQSQVMTWLSTHPATQDRIKHVDSIIAQNGLPTGETAPERLQPIKQRLASHR